jgi:hypothetical protein
MRITSDGVENDFVPAVRAGTPVVAPVDRR